MWHEPNVFHNIQEWVGEGWPENFDVFLEILHHEVLENDWMKPDIHLGWSYEIDCVRDWTAGGLPTAPTFEADQLKL